MGKSFSFSLPREGPDSLVAIPNVLPGGLFVTAPDHFKPVEVMPHLAPLEWFPPSSLSSLRLFRDAAPWLGFNFLT